MTDKQINIHLGEGFEAVAKRVKSAWKRAARGEKIYERHVSFVSWDLLASVMTNRRYELLRYVHNHPTKNIASLAREMRRDYKRVYEDVHALESVGLINLQDGMLRTDYDRIDSSIQL
jgi:predicted transcriptional regulator